MPLIVLDGPDATGTSTQCGFLAERLRAQGFLVIQTAEPTSGPVGTEIRTMLRGGANVSPLELQLLFCKDRTWHVEHVLQPALDAGNVIICDRYWHSTIVYAAAQGLPTDELQRINDAFPQPAITFFTLPPFAVAMQRMQKRSEKDVFEKEDFQRRIHDEYWKLSRTGQNIHVIDTSGDKQVTASEIERLAKTVI